MFFPLKFRCDIKRRHVSEDERSRQQNIVVWEDFSKDTKCLFIETSGSRDASAPMDRYSGVLGFYVEPATDVHEGDRIVDIRTKDGTVIEPGPFLVLSVKKVVNHLSGQHHHTSCKLQGLAHAGDH